MIFERPFRIYTFHFSILKTAHVVVIFLKCSYNGGCHGNVHPRIFSKRFAAGYPSEKTGEENL